jgi:hypothetical protein
MPMTPEACGFCVSGNRDICYRHGPPHVQREARHTRALTELDPYTGATPETRAQALEYLARELEHLRDRAALLDGIEAAIAAHHTTRAATAEALKAWTPGARLRRRFRAAGIAGATWEGWAREFIALPDAQKAGRGRSNAFERWLLGTGRLS